MHYWKTWFLMKARYNYTNSFVNKYSVLKPCQHHCDHNGVTPV